MLDFHISNGTMHRVWIIDLQSPPKKERMVAMFYFLETEAIELEVFLVCKLSQFWIGKMLSGPKTEISSWPANFVFWYYWESDWDCFLVWHVSHFFKVCKFDLDISALWSEILNICKVAFEFKPSNDLGMALTWNSPNQLEEHFLTFNEALWKRGMKNIFKNSLIRFSILVDCA